MIRTYPICQGHTHRQQESLRGILRRLEQDIAARPPRVIPATRRPGAPRRVTF